MIEIPIWVLVILIILSIPTVFLTLIIIALAFEDIDRD